MTLRRRREAERAAEAARQEIAELVAAGKIKVVVDPETGEPDKLMGCRIAVDRRIGGRKGAK